MTDYRLIAAQLAYGRPFKFFRAAGDQPSRIVDRHNRDVVVLPMPTMEDIGEALAFAMNNDPWRSALTSKELAERETVDETERGT